MTSLTRSSPLSVPSIHSTVQCSTEEKRGGVDADWLVESFCGSLGMGKVRQTALCNYQKYLCLGGQRDLAAPPSQLACAVDCNRVGEGHSVASGQPVIGAAPQRARLSADAEAAPFLSPATSDVLHFLASFRMQIPQAGARCSVYHAQGTCFGDKVYSV